ncbi:MAG: Yip1 family protein, partial [Calditrichia bacterium]
MNEKDKKKPDEPRKDEVQKDLDDILGQLKESEKSPPAPLPKSRREKKPAKPTPPPEKPAAAENPPRSEPEELEDILEKISEKKEAEEPAPEKMNVFQRIIGIFTNPRPVFEYLRSHPDYITPLLIVIAASIIANVLIYDLALDQRVERIEQNDRLPDEQRDAMIENINSSRYGMKRIIFSYVFPPLGVIIVFAIVSAIFLLIGNTILGGKARFVQVFSAYSYSALIMAIAANIVLIPLMLARQSIDVNASPTIFMPASMENSALYRFLGSFDIFTIWFLVVFGIGFAVIYRFSQLKGLATVFTTWLIYIIIF